MPKFLKPSCRGRGIWDTITVVLMFAEYCCQDCEMRLLVLFSIRHSLASPGHKAETADCLGRAFADWLSTTPQYPEAHHTNPCGCQTSRLSHLASQDSQVSPASLLLYITLYCIERGVTRNRWRRGQGRLPHSAAVLIVAGWANPEPCASTPWPSGAPASWELSDRWCSPPCVQICLPSNSGVISPKKEIQLWFSYTPRRYGHYFDRFWRIKQGLKPSSKGSWWVCMDWRSHKKKLLTFIAGWNSWNRFVTW